MRKKTQSLCSLDADNRRGQQSPRRNVRDQARSGRNHDLGLIATDIRDAQAVDFIDRENRRKTYPLRNSRAALMPCSQALDFSGVEKMAKWQFVTLEFFRDGASRHEDGLGLGESAYAGEPLLEAAMWLDCSRCLAASCRAITMEVSKPKDLTQCCSASRSG